MVKVKIYILKFSFIFWIKSNFSKDKLRIFILLDKFTQLTNNEEIFFKEDEFILQWIEYAEMCNDEVKVYKFMLDKGIFSIKNSVIDKIINFYCNTEDFRSAINFIRNFSKNSKEVTKRKFYEKLKNILENKINDCFKNSVIFPDVINNFLNKKFGVKNENISEEKENINTLNIIQFNYNEDVKETKHTVEVLVNKYSAIKDFLLKYDEEFKIKEESKLNYKNYKKPSSWLNKERIKQKLSGFIIIKTLKYLHSSDYYKNCIESHQSYLIDFAMKQTKNFPKNCKLEFESEKIEKDNCEFMFKINQLVISKYDKENYSTKISLINFINNNFHLRSQIINYAVKNIIYLHGINEFYLGLFTPFYFMLFDTKNLTFVCRHRFETNHFTEESATLYISNYNPRIILFSISNIIYKMFIDNRMNISISNIFEGHKNDISKLSYKFVEEKHLLISSSKTQIMIWDLDNANVYKLFSIDESKLLIKQLILLNMNSLCIMTVYNQMYLLEFADSNLIKNIKVKNFSDEEHIFDISSNYNINNFENDFVLKLNNLSLSIYDCQRDKEIIHLFKNEQNFKNKDLIFNYGNQIIKKCSKNNNKVLVYMLN